MDFRHSGEIWRDFPELVPGVLFADGVGGTGGSGGSGATSGTSDAAAQAGSRLAAFTEVARSRLAAGTEAELPEIQAWRRAFSRMGLKPTQYRCASESLLRRFRKEGSLPRVHPLVDLCNAISLAFAIPVAVFDVSRITGSLEVRYADGDEEYLAFSGDTEHPAPHEVIFADSARRVHARRWTNRQSGFSAVADSTAAALIVAEAMHDSAARDVPELMQAVAGELAAVWPVTPRAAVLTEQSPVFSVAAADRPV